jgi:hypothetical protein
VFTGQQRKSGAIEDETAGEGESEKERGGPVARAPLVLISPFSPIISRKSPSNHSCKFSSLWPHFFGPHPKWGFISFHVISCQLFNRSSNEGVSKKKWWQQKAFRDNDGDTHSEAISRDFGASESQPSI